MGGRIRMRKDLYTYIETVVTKKTYHYFIDASNENEADNRIRTGVISYSYVTDVCINETEETELRKATKEETDLYLERI